MFNSGKLQKKFSKKGIFMAKFYKCAQKHSNRKTRVATDWANLRAYYAEIQADFISTGKYNKKVPYEDKQGSTGFDAFGLKEITFLNGQKVKMQEGRFWVREDNSKGYTIAYNCNTWDAKCELILGSYS